MAARQGLTLGRCYTRIEIRERLGGGGICDFLPHLRGEVLAACLDPRRNLNAPELVDVGPGPQRTRWAEAAARQSEPLPVFLKRAPKQWEYAGAFTPAGYITTGRELEEGRRRRSDTVGVLRLRRAR